MLDTNWYFPYIQMLFEKILLALKRYNGISSVTLSRCREKLKM